MSENNDTSNESNSLGSDSMQASRLSGTNPVRLGVLRPSVLGSAALNNRIACGGAAAVTVRSGEDAPDAKSKVEEVNSNPFMKEQKDDEDEDEDSNTAAAAATVADENEGAAGGCEVGEAAAASATNKVVTASGSVTTADGKKHEDEEELDERPDPLTMLRKNGLERSSLFAAAKNSIPRVERSGFVFGQNVHERVVGENINPDGTSKTENSEAGASSSSELLFSSVIENAAKSNESDGAAAAAAGTSKDITEVKSLTDVAREYEESRAQKRKYEEVETFTGEENEINIVDISCKLFAFVNSNWEERGRGSLRLNDSKNEQECSRVVFRTSGNLRLLLNTKVWAGMVAERPSQKSLRLTAMDNTGKIKIFLAMARPVDINQLHKALVERIDLRKISHPEECHAAAAENNGNNDEAKNGAAGAEGVPEHEHEAAAKAAEPEHEDSTEPSPKKTLLAETPTNN